MFRPVIDLDQGGKSLFSLAYEQARQSGWCALKMSESAVSISEADILDQLGRVIDPELGMNIVDLGLVYEVQVAHDAVSVSMTMTTPACPIASHLVDQVKLLLRSQFPALQSIDVQLVWEPLWNPFMMSWKARAQLGWA